MKTIQQIKDEIAVKHGFLDWYNLLFKTLDLRASPVNIFLDIENEAMQTYAQQLAEAACEELRGRIANYVQTYGSTHPDENHFEEIMRIPVPLNFIKQHNK